MINKRLIDMLHRSKKYISLTVPLNWISLLANTVSIFFIGGLLEKVLAKTVTTRDIQTTALIILASMTIRTISNIYSTKTSYLASAEVKKTLRKKVYEKLLKLGASYNEKISTSQVVQVTVEGIEQLETYFGGYLPQLLYSLLAQLKLFIIISFISLKSALVLLFCVPLELKSNKIIGIHGRSGSGKSTLLKLLMRFWDVDSGKVNISNENIKDINTDNLRDLESYVTQETFLFNDTIGNNIGIGKEGASLDEIKIAAKKASIDKFIETLPKGYDTNVGELGGSISSGEKQRIGIARAFLHDALFVLLDEPTSNLDSLNEGIILKALKEESKDKTMVLVSHRESTMNIAYIVHHVENGRLS